MATWTFGPARVAKGEQQVRGRLPVRPASDRRAESWVRHHVLGEAIFRDALVRQRRRADRSNDPFAVLLVGWAHGSPGPSRWAAVLRAVAAVKRDTDVVGWLDQDGVVGLLLEDARGMGAVKVMHRLRLEINDRFGGEVLAGLSIRLYAHGDQCGTEGAALPSVDLLIEAFTDTCRRPWRDYAKRALDVAGSLGLLALFSPVLLACAVAVKVTSPGPVLYRQPRIGRRGEPFTMLKFRTMHANADHGIHQNYVSWFIKESSRQPKTGHEVFKLTNDPRITRVGGFLRKLSLDELPQFLNVLSGEMSLVGPRPPLPFEVEQYQAWHRRRVFEAKPGITGPWQVDGRSRTTFDEMVRLDLRYARTHTLWTDIKILAATPAAMISGKGAC